MSTPMHTQHEMCRLVGHAWEHTVDPDWQHTFGIPISWGCLRCATIRHDLVGGGGRILCRNYAYPDGYLCAKG